MCVCVCFAYVSVNVQIENQKLDFKAQSKVGSLSNVTHKPGGGDVKIFDDKKYLKQMSGGAEGESEGRASGAQVHPETTPIVLFGVITMHGTDQPLSVGF